MKRLTTFVLSAAAVGVLCVASATAGIVVVIDTESLSGSPENNGTAKLFLESDRIRIDSTEGGGDVTIIYSVEKPDEPAYFVIDQEKKTYYEITSKDMAELRARVDQARATFEAQAMNMPPERREEAKRVFEQQFGSFGEATEPTAYKKVASGIKLDKWGCSQYEGHRDGVKREEVWAAEWKSLQIKKSDVKALYEMGDLFQSVGQEMPAFFQFGKVAEVDASVDGFPILVVSYADGARKEKSQVKEIRKEKLDPTLFTVPEGFQKMAILGR